jgi:hypothetical protein
MTFRLWALRHRFSNEEIGYGYMQTPILQRFPVILDHSVIQYDGEAP